MRSRELRCDESDRLQNTPALVDDIAVIEWREQVRADSEHVTPWVEWPDLPDYTKQEWREEFRREYLAAQSNKGEV